MRQRHVHPETGHQTDDALRYGKRLTVTGGVSPGHGDFLAFQVFQRTKVLAQPGEIGHGLGRVVDIALQVNQRRTLRQNALLIAIIQRGADFAHIGVARSQEHIVANTNGIGAERDHVGGFTHGFAVGDL